MWSACLDGMSLHRNRPWVTDVDFFTFLNGARYMLAAPQLDQEGHLPTYYHPDDRNLVFNPAPPGVFPYPRPPGGLGRIRPPAISKTVNRSEPGEAAFKRTRRVVPKEYLRF